MRKIPVFAGVVSALWLSAAASQATDLMDIYRLALENDPLILEAEATLDAVSENKPQALAGLLPEVNFSGQFDDQDSEGTTTATAFTGGAIVTTDRPSDLDRRSWTLQLTQPLFRWDRWIALKRADKQVALEQANYATARQELAVRVAQRYFDALAAKDALEAQQANTEAIARQLEQAETRFEVGLIAITDVYESRAAYDQSVANEILARRTLAVARDALREITGQVPEGDLGAPGDDLPLIGPDPASEDAWVQRALAQNLSVEASRLAVQIAEDDIRSQRTGHYPNVDLVLSRNDFDSDGTRFDVDNGTGFVSGGVSKQDFETDTIAIQFFVPLYSGGAVASRVRQAAHQKTAATHRLERTAREVERQTRDAYLGVQAEISRVNALAQAVTSAETALEATQAGFDVGTRTSVDVLNARRDLLRAQTNHRRARYDYLLNVALLKQAAGTLSGEDLAEINRWLTH